jgi:hypothetical protein
MIPDTLLQALSLDLSVLEALLQQHRCSHGRAKYFSRISMTLRSIQRYNFSDIPSQLTMLEKEVNTLSQQRKRKQRRNEEEAWELKKTTKDPVLVHLEQQLSNLQQTLCEHLPQVLSRIQHASAALFKEVSRGFFLPFCTVALAALARTRMLLRRLGRLALVDLNQLKGAISEILGKSSIFLTSDQMEQGISMYMEPSGPPNFTIQNDAIRAQTLASLGLTNVQFKSETQSNQDNKGETSNMDLSVASADEYLSNLGMTAAPMEDDDDSDDLGECMEGNRTELEADDIEQVGPAADDSQSNLHPSDPMDRNMALVANIKATKQDKKTPMNKKSKKDSKKRKEAERARPPAGEKKKKKKGSGDFFDSLFD